MAIAVDAMGGDRPLTVQVEAAVKAVKDFGIEVIIVGAEAQINEQLKQFSYDQQKVRVVNSTEIVEMNESPATALRQKKTPQSGLLLILSKQVKQMLLSAREIPVPQWQPQSLSSSQSRE